MMRQTWSGIERIFELFTVFRGYFLNNSILSSSTVRCNDCKIIQVFSVQLHESFWWTFFFHPQIFSFHLNSHNFSSFPRKRTHTLKGIFILAHKFYTKFALLSEKSFHYIFLYLLSPFSTIFYFISFSFYPKENRKTFLFHSKFHHRIFLFVHLKIFISFFTR